MRRLMLSLVAVCGVGCGPTTYAGLCEDAADALCRQLYRCQPDTARATWPNIQDCKKSLTDSVRCNQLEAQTCKVDAYKSSACIDDIDNLRCDQNLTVPTSCDLPCL